MRLVQTIIAAALSLTACSSPEEKFCAKAVECGNFGTEKECIAKVGNEFQPREVKAGACDPLHEAIDAYVECMTEQTCSEFVKFGGRGSPCIEEMMVLDEVEEDARPDCIW